MSKEMVISANPHETRVAILEEGQLCEYYVEREKEFALVGSIYKGSVTRVLPGMQSAFVEIGLDSDAFLYVSDFLEEIEELDHVVTAVEDKDPKDGSGRRPGVSRQSRLCAASSSPWTSNRRRLRRSRASCRRIDLRRSRARDIYARSAPLIGKRFWRRSRPFRKSFARPARPAAETAVAASVVAVDADVVAAVAAEDAAATAVSVASCPRPNTLPPAIRRSRERTGNCRRAHFSSASRGISREVQRARPWGCLSVGSSIIRGA